MPSEIPDPQVARERLDVAPTLSPADYACLLGCGLPIVYRGLKDGSIPAVRLGARYRIPTSYVRRQLGLD